MLARSAPLPIHKAAETLTAAKFVEIDHSTAKQILIGCGISFERDIFHFHSAFFFFSRKISLDELEKKRNQIDENDRLEIEIVKRDSLSRKTSRGSKCIQFSRHFVFNYRLNEPR